MRKYPRRCLLAMCGLALATGIPQVGLACQAVQRNSARASFPTVQVATADSGFVIVARQNPIVGPVDVMVRVGAGIRIDPALLGSDRHAAH